MSISFSSSKLDLPKVQKVYCDEAFAYDTMYADKVIQGKGGMTNRIENLNSQLRDLVCTLSVRK
jgi:IS1 family transposase